MPDRFEDEEDSSSGSTSVSEESNTDDASKESENWSEPSSEQSSEGEDEREEASTVDDSSDEEQVDSDDDDEEEEEDDDEEEESESETEEESLSEKESEESDESDDSSEESESSDTHGFEDDDYDEDDYAYKEREDFYDEEDPADKNDSDGEFINKEEAQEEKRAFSRKAMISIALCCACLLAVIVAIVLAVVLTKEDDDSPRPSPSQPRMEPTPAPVVAAPTFVFPTLPPAGFPTEPVPTSSPTQTPEPTGMPSDAPTENPTASPSDMPSTSFQPTFSIPDELFLSPEADTYIVTEGLAQAVGAAYGSRDTLLVQNGPAQQNDVPDAFSLLTFNLERVPLPFRIEDRNPQAFLRLNHVVREDADELSPSTLTVARVPFVDGILVETLHGDLYAPFSKVIGPSFTVNPLDTAIEVDVTSLIFEQPPFVNEADVRHLRRQMQGLGSDFLFLIVENQGEEQPLGGDRFFSREADDGGPELYIRIEPSGPRVPSTNPTSFPTDSMAPSTTPTQIQSATPTQIQSTTPTSSVESI